MRNPPQSLRACALAVIMCMIWVISVSAGLAWMFHLSVSTGWMVAGGLSVVATGGLALIIYEMRHAIELPEDFMEPTIAPAPRPRREAMAPARMAGRSPHTA